MSLANNAAEIEWAPGEKTAWKPVDSTEVQRDQALKNALSQVLKHSVTAIATAKDYIYAGDSEGRLWVSADAGVSWGAVSKLGDSGKVEAIWVDPSDPRVAVAALNARTSAAPNAQASYVLRTMNGGGFWDDITANLPDTASAHGVTADRASGAIYVATDAGVFFTATDLGSAGRPTDLDLARGQTAGGRGHRREIGCRRKSDLCRDRWIWSLFGHRSASAARRTRGERGGL